MLLPLPVASMSPPPPPPPTPTPRQFCCMAAHSFKPFFLFLVNKSLINELHRLGKILDPNNDEIEIERMQFQNKNPSAPLPLPVSSLPLPLQAPGLYQCPQF
jgi:hypothetical protein